MSERETDAFRNFVVQANSYFEFGIGGSTYEAGQLVKGRVVAIDSDPSWVDQARNFITPSVFERKLVHVDIGPTMEWGFPVSLENPNRFKAYYKSIENHSPGEFDFCLIDGRFRIACFLNSLKYARNDTILSMHDYRSRSGYHLVEQFGRIIMEVEDIVFFVKRNNINLVYLESTIENYAANPH